MILKRADLICALLLALTVRVPGGANTSDIAAAQRLAPNAPEGQTPGMSRLGIGRTATPDEIVGWDIDIRPDGEGLPPGKGTVKDGEVLFTQQCSGCHGEFGEGVGRWPMLAGGASMLTADRPIKTIGSYWPYASTIFDYVRRAQPFGNAQSLNHDELYAVVAYLLFLNDIVDRDFELTRESFRKIRMPNERGFHDDDRETAERSFWNPNPCMTNCKVDVKIIGRARILDATPAGDNRQRDVD